MKISKYVQLLKRKGHGRVVHIADSGNIVLSTHASLYKAYGLPDMRGEDQIMTVLDIEPKQREKIYISEDYAASIDDVYGMNLEDGMEETVKARKLQMVVFVNGRYAQVLEADDGELLFYDETLLMPLSDRMKESEYIELAVRETAKGVRYIVFMDGFEVLAAIMPMDIVSADYLKELKKFETKVYEQYLRQERRKLEQAEAAEENNDYDPETGEVFEEGEG